MKRDEVTALILAGGKAAGLAAATTSWLFVDAGDMP
jgi:molybdopterin-guanine dinucleotide biosynthesis protein A